MRRPPRRASSWRDTTRRRNMLLPEANARMAETNRIDADGLVAIDVHVHIEHTEEETATDAASAKYFGAGDVARDRASIAEYYRSRKMGCVVFSVDERLSGRPQVPNDVVAEFAAENADVAIAFASLDPHRGPEAVREARRLVDAGLVRGLKLHPPLQQFFPNDRMAYPLYEVFAEAKLPVLFHTGH